MMPENDSSAPSAGSRTPAVWLATGLGVGFWFPAPGTAGALWGSLAAWGISYLPGQAWQALVIVALNLVGIPLCTAAGRDLGGKKDNQAIVWDELASLPIVFLLVPLENWRIGLLGFLLHRLFDVTKPPPARQLERLPEGLGVMADDWAASVYACLVLWLMAELDHRFGTGLFALVGG